MCPPGKIRYFFTLDKIAVQAKDHLKTLEKVTNPVLIKGIEMYDEVKDYKIKRFNYKLIEQSEVLND